MNFLPLVMAWAAFVATDTDGPTRCAGWYQTMAWVNLKNLGLIDPDKVSDTQGKSELIALQKLDNGHLSTQVYRISFPAKTGDDIQVIATGKSSDSECSNSGVNIYVIAKAIDGGS